MLNDKIHSLNEIFDKKRDDFLKLLEDRRREAIAKATVEDVIENLPNMSVGNVLSIFENVSSEVLKTKGGKKTINDFVKMVKEDKNLQNTYMLKENVFSGSISVSARDILVESINTAKENSNTKAFKESKKNIVNFVAEALKKVSPVNIYEKVVLDEEVKKINDNLELLVWEKKTVKNAGKRTESLKETVDFMSNDKKGKTQEDVFEECKKECIDTISEAWEHADANVRLKLTEVKDRLSKKMYSELTAEDDIKYMKELMQTIK